MDANFSNNHCKNIFTGLFVAALLLLLAGCSTVQVQSDYDSKANFTNLKTFAWLPEPQKKTGDPRIDDNSLLANRIHRSVDSVLGAKGFRKVALEEADFAIGYHVTLSKQTDVQVINRYYDYGPGWGGRYGARNPYYYGPGRSQAYVFEFDMGTLILDIVKPEQRQLIWRGSATDEVNFSASKEAKDEKVQQAVEKVFADFPPR